MDGVLLVRARRTAHEKDGWRSGYSCCGYTQWDAAHAMKPAVAAFVKCQGIGAAGGCTPVGSRCLEQLKTSCMVRSLLHNERIHLLEAPCHCVTSTWRNCHREPISSSNWFRSWAASTMAIGKSSNSSR